jgi:hypothetical protein
VEGGCRAAEPDGSIAAGISVTALPLVNSGDSMAGISAGASSTGFTLVFFVETLGIDKIKLAGLTGFQLPDVTGRHVIGRPATGIVQTRMTTNRSVLKLSYHQYGKGNFAVNSRTR